VYRILSGQNLFYPLTTSSTGPYTIAFSPVSQLGPVRDRAFTFFTSLQSSLSDHKHTSVHVAARALGSGDLLCV